MSSNSRSEESSLAQVPDEDLLAVFLAGNEAMFEELVRRYERPIYSFICRLSGNPDVAAGLFQETFARVFRSASSFRGQSTLKTWIYGVAANACRSHARRSKKSMVRLKREGLESPDASPGPNGPTEAKEIGKCIAAAVQHLPREQRDVFILRAYDEMSYSEIASALLRPLGTVKSQMRLALRRLRAELRSLAEAYGVRDVGAA